MKPFKVITAKGNKFQIAPEIANLYPFTNIKMTDENIKWMAYIHYLLYPIPEDNPFFYLSEIEKEDTIAKRLKLNLLNKPEWYQEVYDIIYKQYEMPNIRIFRTLKTAMDKVSSYLENISVDDKNFKNISSFLKEYEVIRETYRKVLKDVENEINFKSKGNTKIGYDLS